MLYFSADDLVRQVHEGVLNALFEQIYEYYGEKVRVHLIVEGLEAYFRATRLAITREQRVAMQQQRVPDPVQSEDGHRMEERNYAELSLELQFSENVQVIECPTVHESILAICHWTRALANLRIKKSLSLFENFCAEAAPRRSAKTPNEAYRAVLEQIPGVSSAVADAISARFPTLRALVEPYYNGLMPAEQKKRLLENIEVFARAGAPGRRLGPVLSEKIYRIFTESDGSILL
jgi:hypothetical protein